MQNTPLQHIPYHYAFTTQHGLVLVPRSKYTSALFTSKRVNYFGYVFEFNYKMLPSSALFSVVKRLITVDIKTRTKCGSKTDACVHPNATPETELTEKEQRMR